MPNQKHTSHSEIVSRVAPVSSIRLPAKVVGNDGLKYVACSLLKEMTSHDANAILLHQCPSRESNETVDVDWLQIG
ncbi:hypothetical protein K227x_42660 [Rubripirellula lacrimiformis]|uniref:Uncharacterized protein n=1 Tax=Rubripirellula lacrimiformis TaxID=1930273 RepID=A0A517NFF6_9BACT|nr:hypothetical protein K227x_42660 [Rubripirellula lacrimiformis]